MKWMLRTALRTLSVFVLFGGLGTATIGTALFFLVTRGLPDVSSLRQYQATRASEVFSEDGKKIGEFTTERRYPVAFDEIPQLVKDAFIAAEDANFYRHGGVDFTGILRAARSNLIRGKFAQGASTITQQVARGLLLNRKKEITRKLREMVLANQMEKILSKDEILNLYLNDIYLGHGAYGIGAASQNYFHKRVQDLTLAEAALIAGLPQRPNDWDPFHNPHFAKLRQQYVLRRMVDEKKITVQLSKAALEEPLRLFALDDLNNTAAPFFTEQVRQYLMNKYGPERVLTEGMKIYTTLRYDFQKQAEKVIDRGLRAVDKRQGWRGVRDHLEDKEKTTALLNSIHEGILEKWTASRILYPTTDPKNKKLAYDLSGFENNRAVHFGQTPLIEGEFYTAIVTGLDIQRGEAIGKIGYTPFRIPASEFEWVKLKSPGLKQVSQILQVGDVIQVKVVRLDRPTLTAQVTLEQEPEIQGALLSFDLDTGYVRAMVGGTDFRKSKFNIALQGKRQVGSAFKPVIYAAALDRGFSPSSMVTDSPIVFKYEGQLDADNPGETWRPHNYEGHFQGDIPLRAALIHSMNIPTVKLLNELTIDYVIQYAKNLGIASTFQRDLSIALGSSSSSLDELCRAYAVFPRLGQAITTYFIKKVLDFNGKAIEDNTATEKPVSPPPVAEVPSSGPPSHPTIISPQTAYVLTDMLRGVVREGTGSAAAIVPGAAGKTGTTSDHRDAWFIGYTPKVMTGIWLGHERDKPLQAGETGGKAAAPIWADYMANVIKYYPQIDYPIPDEIAFAYIDRETGKLANASTQRRVKVAFKVGMVPNSLANNLPRIGEPSARWTSNALGTDGKPAPPPRSEDNSDYLRQGYQD